MDLSNYITIVRCNPGGLILHDSFMDAYIPAYLSKDIIRFFKYGDNELDFNNRFFMELYDDVCSISKKNPDEKRWRPVDPDIGDPAITLQLYRSCKLPRSRRHERHGG